VQNASFIIIFPITFIANTFVPTNNFPPVLKTFADWNPVSSVTLAARELFGNSSPALPPPDVWPLLHPVVVTLFPRRRRGHRCREGPRGDRRRRRRTTGPWLALPTRWSLPPRPSIRSPPSSKLNIWSSPGPPMNGSCPWLAGSRLGRVDLELLEAREIDLPKCAVKAPTDARPPGAAATITMSRLAFTLNSNVFAPASESTWSLPSPTFQVNSSAWAAPSSGSPGQLPTDRTTHVPGRPRHGDQPTRHPGPEVIHAARLMLVVGTN